MSDITCPLCQHEYDSGYYPDHIAEARNNRFEFQCGACGLAFTVDIEWEPVFWSSLDGSYLISWSDPTC